MVIVTGVWNVLARVVLPVVGILAILIGIGQLNPVVAQAAIIGALIGLAVIVAFWDPRVRGLRPQAGSAVDPRVAPDPRQEGRRHGLREDPRRHAPRHHRDRPLRLARDDLRPRSASSASTTSCSGSASTRWACRCRSPTCSGPTRSAGCHGRRHHARRLGVTEAGTAAVLVGGAPTLPRPLPASCSSRSTRTSSRCPSACSAGRCGGPARSGSPRYRLRRGRGLRRCRRGRRAARGAPRSAARAVQRAGVRALPLSQASSVAGEGSVS